MKLRALTALVLIPPVLYLSVWSPGWLFLAVLLVVVERTVYEYFELSRAAGLGGYRWLGYVGSAALCLGQWAGVNSSRSSIAAGAMGEAASALVVAALIVPFGLTVALVWTRELRGYLSAACSTLFGIFYVGLTLSFLVPLRLSSALVQQRGTAVPHRYLVLFLFMVIWAGDIFAYVVGRGVGRTLIFPHISPKKTLEGSLAGLAGSLLVAWALTRWWQTSDLKTVMLLAGLVALAGQAGDLVESALKRSADIKDSGSLLPGHGGLLDRLDSLIFGAPVLWAALALKHLKV
jgi:phosphatidate cytidylyltransferase